MIAVLPWVEVVGGLLGIAGSVVLALPAIRDLGSKELSDKLGRIGRLPGGKAIEDGFRWDLLKDMQGGYRYHLRCVAAGCALLVLGFLLIAVAGGVRIAAPAAGAPVAAVTAPPAVEVHLPVAEPVVAEPVLPDPVLPDPVLPEPVECRRGGRDSIPSPSR